MREEQKEGAKNIAESKEYCRIFANIQEGEKKKNQARVQMTIH